MHIGILYAALSILRTAPRTAMCLPAIVDLLTHLSALFNGSVPIYDPYEDRVLDILTFPGISNNFNEHLGGVGWDQYTDQLSIVVDDPTSFVTAGANVSGNYYLIKYDLEARKVLYTLNLTETTQGKYGGFQDVQHDSRGNTYVVGSWPTSILRVSPGGKNVVPWYLPEPIVTTNYGCAGLAATGNILLSNDNLHSQILRFNMLDNSGNPVPVPITPTYTFNFTEAIHLPPAYGGKVLLVAEDLVGVSVLYSEDGSWTSAEYLGTIPNNQTLAPGSIIPATVQIGQSQYMMTEWDDTDIVPGTTAGNRTDFPMIDLTAQIDAWLIEAQG